MPGTGSDDAPAPESPAVRAMRCRVHTFIALRWSHLALAAAVAVMLYIYWDDLTPVLTIAGALILVLNLVGWLYNDNFVRTFTLFTDIMATNEELLSVNAKLIEHIKGLTRTIAQIDPSAANEASEKPDDTTEP